MTTIDPTTDMLPRDQRELIRRVNRTEAPVPDGTLDEQVASVAAAGRGATAVVSARRTLTYGELADEVSDLARRLVAAGLAAGDRIVLCVELGWEQAVGALASTRIGATYVPVSPDLAPSARWEIADRLRASAVLTQWWLAGRVAWPERMTVITVDPATAGVDEPPPGASAGDPGAAAVTLAGGAAGSDVTVVHRVLSNVMADANRRLGLGPGDRVLALAPAESALSLPEMFGPLLAGAAVVFGPDSRSRRPQEWLDQLERDGVTVWMLTPSLLTLLLDHLAGTGGSLSASLRAVVLTGERLSQRLVRELRSVAPGLTVAYATAAAPHGPWIAWHDLDGPGDAGPSVPIGGPLANQRLFVLAETLAPCPAWVVGLLHLGGVAAESATGPGVRHPQTGEPLLVTGLFARLRPDGVVEVVGDQSSRITVHGQQLNLRDTEVALVAHDDVREAVVVPVGDSSMAYVRVRSGAAASGPDLLGHLRRKVSPYLLPDRIEMTATMPLTSDGRLDRAALAAMARPADAPDRSARRPSSADEDLLRKVSAVAWRLFDLPDIEPDTNLFDVGANSFQLVRLAIALEEELGVSVSVEELLRSPSIAAIVEHLGPSTGREPGRDGPPVPEADRTAGQPAAGLLTGIKERQAFTDARLGLRHDLDSATGLALPAPPAERISARRTVRAFDPEPVSFAALGTLLSAAGAVVRDGEPRYWYPSAGSAYPVQVYLLVAPGRVRGLATGSYYYHPADNRLVAIDPDAMLASSVHLDINRAAARGSAFSVFLVGRMDAIVPLYGDRSLEFAVFEAGAMTQVFSEVATECGLGLCPIGSMDVAPLPALFGLSENDRFLHALLGGVPQTREA